MGVFDRLKDEILEWNNQGKTYNQMADLICIEHYVVVDGSSLSTWFKQNNIIKNKASTRKAKEKNNRKKVYVSSVHNAFNNYVSRASSRRSPAL